ncbi:hypothetical protein ABK040_015086 [Willaertia magna]
MLLPHNTLQCDNFFTLILTLFCFILSSSLVKSIDIGSITFLAPIKSNVIPTRFQLENSYFPMYKFETPSRFSIDTNTSIYSTSLSIQVSSFLSSNPSLLTTNNINLTNSNNTLNGIQLVTSSHSNHGFLFRNTLKTSSSSSLLIAGFGDNTRGQIGSLKAVGSTWIDLTDISNQGDLINVNRINKIIIGNSYSILLVDTTLSKGSMNRLIVMGDNSLGALGFSNSTKQLNQPTLISDLTNILDICSTGNDTYFLTNSGQLYQLLFEKRISIFINNNTISFSKLFCGFGSVFVVERDLRSVWVFGNNRFGKLGINNLESEIVTIPTKLTINDLNNNEIIVKIVSGEEHTVLLTSNNRVLSVGSTSLLGNALVRNNNLQFIEIDKTFSGTIFNLEANSDCTVFLTNEGNVYVFGKESLGYPKIATLMTSLLKENSLIPSMGSNSISLMKKTISLYTISCYSFGFADTRVCDEMRGTCLGYNRCSCPPSSSTCYLNTGDCSTFQTNCAPQYSLPSSVEAFANMELNVPAIMTQDNNIVKKFPSLKFFYDWKILDSNNNMIFNSNSSLLTFNKYQRTWFDKSNQLSFTIQSKIIGVDSINANTIVFKYRKNIPLSVKSLGLYFTILNENQVIPSTTNYISTIIQLYDTYLHSGKVNCKWDCRYITTESSNLQSCENMNLESVYSESNCNGITISNKSPVSYDKIKYFTLRAYLTDNIFTYQTDPYSISFAQSSPKFSITSNINKLKYHPSNIGVALKANVDYIDETKGIIYSWKNSLTNEIISNEMILSLNNLQPFTKYSLQCSVSFVNNPNNPKFKIQDNIKAWFQIFASTPRGNLSLTNGKYFATLPAFIARLPMINRNILNLTVVASDGFITTYTDIPPATYLDINKILSMHPNDLVTNIETLLSNNIINNEVTFYPSNLMIGASALGEYINTNGYSSLSASANLKMKALVISLLEICIQRYEKINDNEIFYSLEALHVTSHVASVLQYTTLPTLSLKKLYNLINLHLNTILNSKHEYSFDESSPIKQFSMLTDDSQLSNLIGIMQNIDNLLNNTLNFNFNFLVDKILGITELSNKQISTSYTSMTRTTFDGLNNVKKLFMPDGMASVEFINIQSLKSALYSLNQLQPIVLSLKYGSISNNGTNPTGKVIEFDVLDASTKQKIELKQLTSPIRLTIPTILSTQEMLQLTNTSNNLIVDNVIKKVECIYYDEKKSIWSTDGCQYVGNTNYYFICECNHTSIYSTHFVIQTIPTPPVTNSFPYTGLIVILCLTIIVTPIIFLIYFLVGYSFEQVKQMESMNDVTSSEPSLFYDQISNKERFLDCLKRYHVYIGLFLTPKYTHFSFKRIDKLILITITFITFSTINMIIFSCMNSNNWSFIIGTIIALAITIPFIQTPFHLLLYQRERYFKITSYILSSIYFLICFLLEIIATCGTFSNQQTTINVLNWFLGTLFSFLFDFLLIKPIFVISYFALIEYYYKPRKIKDWMDGATMEFQTFETTPTSTAMNVVNNNKVTVVDNNTSQTKQQRLQQYSYSQSLDNSEDFMDERQRHDSLRNNPVILAPEYTLLNKSYAMLSVRSGLPNIRQSDSIVGSIPSLLSMSNLEDEENRSPQLIHSRTNSQENNNEVECEDSLKRQQNILNFWKDEKNLTFVIEEEEDHHCNPKQQKEEDNNIKNKENEVNEQNNNVINIKEPENEPSTNTVVLKEPEVQNEVDELFIITPIKKEIKESIDDVANDETIIRTLLEKKSFRRYESTDEEFSDNDDDDDEIPEIPGPIESVGILSPSDKHNNNHSLLYTKTSPNLSEGSELNDFNVENIILEIEERVNRSVKKKLDLPSTVKLCKTVEDLLVFVSEVVVTNTGSNDSYKIERDMFDQLRIFALENEEKEVMNALLFLEVVYLHYSNKAMKKELRREACRQICNQFPEFTVLVDDIEKISRKSFVSSCIVVEIRLKTLVASFCNMLLVNK